MNANNNRTEKTYLERAINNFYRYTVYADELLDKIAWILRIQTNKFYYVFAKINSLIFKQTKQKSVLGVIKDIEFSLEYSNSSKLLNLLNSKDVSKN